MVTLRLNPDLSRTGGSGTRKFNGFCLGGAEGWPTRPKSFEGCALLWWSKVQRLNPHPSHETKARRMGHPEIQMRKFG